MKPGQYHRLLSDGLGGGADPFALTKPTDTRPTVAPSSSLSSSSPSSSSLRTEASSPGDRPWLPHPHHPCPHRQCHWPTPVHGPPPPHSHLRGLSGQTQRFTDGDSAMRPATRPEPRTMDHQPPPQPQIGDGMHHRHPHATSDSARPAHDTGITWASAPTKTFAPDKTMAAANRDATPTAAIKIASPYG